MATRTWTASGGASNNWTNSSNWNTGVPTTSDIASLDVGTIATYGVNLDTNPTIQSITFLQSGGSGSATFAMNSNSINLNTTGTIFNNTSTGSGAVTFTGTGGFISTNNSGTTKTISAGTNFTVGPNISVGSASTTSCNFAVTGKINSLTIPSTFPGTLTNTARTLTGSLSLSSNGSFACNSGTNATTFAPTSGTVTINMAGKKTDFPININPAAGATVQLSSDVLNYTNLPSTRTLTMGDDGTFDLNGFAVTTGKFISASTNTSRTIAFGSTGSIACGSTGTVVDFFNSVTSSVMPIITGSKQIYITNSGATAVTIQFSNSGGSSSTRAPSFTFNGGTYTCTFSGNGGVTNLDFNPISGPYTGSFGGTWAGFSTNTPIYGNLALSSGMTVSSTSTTLNFISTGTQTFNGAGKTNLGCNLIINGGSSQVVQLVGNSVGFTTSPTFTWSNGGIDLNGLTFTSPNTITMAIGGGCNLLFNGGTFGYPAASFTPAIDFVTTAGTGVGYLSLTNASATYNTSVTLNAVLQFATNLSFSIGNHTIGGLYKNDSTGGTITFPATSTTTITGDITLVGVSGGLINIFSSIAV